MGEKRNIRKKDILGFIDYVEDHCPGTGRYDEETIYNDLRDLVERAFGEIP